MSTEVNVIARTQLIVIDPVSNAVSIINSGPPGPPGPQGPAGGATGPQGPPGPAGPSTVSVVGYGERTVPGSNFAASNVSTGLTTNTFTLPTMAANQYIELSFYVPEFYMSPSRGGYPVVDGTIQLRLKNGAVSEPTLLYGQSIVPNTAVYDRTSPPSVGAKLLMNKTRATEVFPPNSKLTLYGLLGGVSGNQGMVQLNADAGSLRPNISVRLV
jgi:hypothetical protein